MSDDNDTKRLGEEDEALAGDALLHAVRRDMLSLFRALDEKVEALDKKVEALDEKVDARLHDTVPLWEGVVSRLDVVVAEQESQGRRLAAIEAKLERFDAIDTELRHLRRRIERTIGELSTNVVGYRIDQHDLEDRIEKLEKTPA